MTNKTGKAVIKKEIAVYEPQAIQNVFGEGRSFASSTTSNGTRRSSSSNYRNKPSLAGELTNIEAGVTPFNQGKDGSIDVREAILLSQKAYWNVAIYRMTIDIMTEFCNSKLHWRRGNVTSRRFFENWYKKIGGWKLGDQFFREWFRSGSIFFYRIDHPITINTDAIKIIKVPLRYILLNPADIRCEGAASFINANYSKLINSYELERLKNPKTEEEIEFKKNLPADVRKQIDSGSKQPFIMLNQEQLHAIFCKKQDYEPLSVPMFFPVLFDINLKLTFKKVEQVIARTIDYAILLITLGDAENGVNQNIVNSMNELFRTESVGRVLVADWTTKMEFVIPELNKILGPEKYQVVNEDIANGLLNLFFGEDKFANSMVKIKIFLERLKEARKAFLEEFLLPEVERVAKEMNFKTYPIPEFEEVDLKDEVEYFKIYNRLAELGFLTPDETFEAYQSHKLPLPEDSLEHQEEYKKQKDKGLYESPLNKQKDEAGRPSGTKKKQATKKVKPVGASRQFSIEQLKDVVLKSDKLVEAVEAKYKEKFGLKRLSKNHKTKAFEVAKVILTNKQVEEWESSIDDFLEGRGSIDFELNSLIDEISEEHKITNLAAVFLAHSVERE